MSDKNNPSRTILLITVAVAALLIVVIWPLSMLGKGGATPSDADEAELRIQPIARVEMQKAEAAKTDGKPRSGEAVYTAVCSACHAAGVAGAPKTGDKAAWAPRIAEGMDAMMKIAINGKGAMPPRGASTASDDELRAAVQFMVDAAK